MSKLGKHNAMCRHPGHPNVIISVKVQLVLAFKTTFPSSKITTQKYFSSSPRIKESFSPSTQKHLKYYSKILGFFTNLVRSTSYLMKLYYLSSINYQGDVGFNQRISHDSVVALRTSTYQDTATIHLQPLNIELRVVGENP